ncbi:hypothetical protein GCM10009827_101160 [Dactylosporangium maewongense]|uniref:Thymidylate kinase n=1 Tax=Dactylosporangium maewongense TaxID=634393 RepID=A0ABN2CT37_9ACTN
MVVVYVEGVDGTGKTTLINQLIRCHPADATVTAPPLWTYLPAAPVPAAFATWVTTTPAATVAADLLAAQRTRVSDLLALTDQHPIVLVDRGPRTVEASAQAHLTAKPPITPTPAIAQLTAELRATTRHLAEVHPCLSIELTTASYDEIFHRLTDTERASTAYLQYLRRFLREFRDSTAANDPTQLSLPATASLARNTTAAWHAIQALTGRL